MIIRRRRAVRQLLRFRLCTRELCPDFSKASCLLVARDFRLGGPIDAHHGSGFVGSRVAVVFGGMKRVMQSGG